MILICVSKKIPLLVWGIDYPFGIFLGDIMETYATGRTVTSMVVSTQMGMILCVGPVSADLVDKFGCRKVIFVGTLLAVIGLIISGIAPNFAIYFISAGLISGNLNVFSLFGPVECFYQRARCAMLVRGGGHFYALQSSHRSI